MPTYVALLRGINVGGKNIVPMAQLRSCLHEAGFHRVRTYIQSGNVVLDHPSKSTRTVRKLIADTVGDQFGFQPNILVLTTADLRAAIADNPFSRVTGQQKTLHFFFLADPPKSPDNASIAELATDSEQYQLTHAVFYLLAPDGIARSKLAANVERVLGIPVTARNLNTVSKLAELISRD